MVNALFHLLLWLTFPVTEEHPSRMCQREADICADTAHLLQKGKRYTIWKLVTIVLVLMLMHIYYGLEISFGSYALTFAVHSHLKLSKSTGAYLTAAFWSSYTFPKVLAFFLVKWIGSEKTIVCSLVVTLIGNVVLVPFGNDSPLCLWIGTVIVGIGMSSNWGCMFSYVEEIFYLTSSMGSFMIGAAMAGDFVFPTLISMVIEQKPTFLLWTICSYSIAITILFLMIMGLRRTKMKAV